MDCIQIKFQHSRINQQPLDSPLFNMPWRNNSKQERQLDNTVCIVVLCRMHILVLPLPLHWLDHRYRRATAKVQLHHHPQLLGIRVQWSVKTTDLMERDGRWSYRVDRPVYILITGFRVPMLHLPMPYMLTQTHQDGRHLRYSLATHHRLQGSVQQPETLHSLQELVEVLRRILHSCTSNQISLSWTLLWLGATLCQSLCSNRLKRC